MPLDASLNKDIYAELDRHVALTFHLPDDDERKFSRRTPSEQDRGLRRLLDKKFGRTGGGVPSSVRIVQDVEKFEDALVRIVEARGAVVQGLGTRDGHRKYVGAALKRGGKRTKAEYVEKWTHPDARAAVKTFIARSESRAAQS